jgi:hypothetical protein
MTNLPEDLKHLEYEIEEDEAEFDAQADSPEVVVLNRYRYTEETEKKLRSHDLEINDASTVLAQAHFDHSTSSGSLIAIGACHKGTALVVIRAIVNSELRQRADYDVVTGFPI